MKTWLLPVLFVALLCLGITLLVVEQKGRPAQIVSAAESSTESATSGRIVPQKTAEEKEARRLAGQFRWEFLFHYQYGEPIRELSITPGSSIAFNLRLWNRGSEPVSGVKILISPMKYLRLESSGSNPIIVRHQAEMFRRLGTKGLTIYDETGRDTIFPEGSKYHPQNYGSWSTTTYPAFNDAHGEWFVGFESRLKLDPNIKPGKDIHFEGFLLYQDHKISLGTLTIHVMYPG